MDVQGKVRQDNLQAKAALEHILSYYLILNA